MITGCNTNIRHLGKQFHVQTEDSGREHPHIISHVYHGGTIIASEKREYADRIDSADDLDSEVRRLIEEQHNAMLKRLRGGAFDAVIRERLGVGPGQAPSAPVPPAPVPPAQVPAAAEVAAKPPSVEPASAGSGNGATPSRGPGETAPSLDELLPSPEQPSADQPAIPAFGGEADSEKPLDEVILEYLFEKARGRSEERENRPARPSRSKE
jgi:hypothetical protein